MDRREGGWTDGQTDRQIDRSLWALYCLSSEMQDCCVLRETVSAKD